MNERFPKISVILSAWSHSSHLSDSIESIVRQLFSDFEFIIVDDGLTENGKRTLQEFAKKDSRIIVIENPENIGLTKSLNKGIAQAKGDYIARQDAGDISLPGRLEKQFRLLDSNQNIFLCGTNYNLIEPDDSVIENGSPLATRPEEVRKLLPKKNCFVHTSIMFRNDGIRYRDKFYYAQDYDLYLSLLSNGKEMANLEDKLVLWRLDPRAISFSNREKQAKFKYLAKKFYHQRLTSGRDEYDQFHPEQLLNGPVDDRAVESLVKEKILFYLFNQRYQEAGNVFFREYRPLRKRKRLESVFLLIFIRFPAVYRAYQSFKSRFR